MMRVVVVLSTKDSGFDCSAKSHLVCLHDVFTAVAFVACIDAYEFWELEWHASNFCLVPEVSYNSKEVP